MFRSLFSAGCPGAAVDVAVAVSERRMEGSSGRRGLCNPGSEVPRRAQSPGRPPVNDGGRQRHGQSDRHHGDGEDEKQER